MTLAIATAISSRGHANVGKPTRPAPRVIAAAAWYFGLGAPGVDGAVRGWRRGGRAARAARPAPAMRRRAVSAGAGGAPAPRTSGGASAGLSLALATAAFASGAARGCPVAEAGPAPARRGRLAPSALTPTGAACTTPPIAAGKRATASATPGPASAARTASSQTLAPRRAAPLRASIGAARRPPVRSD